MSQDNTIGFGERNYLRIVRLVFAGILSLAVLILSCTYKDVLIGSPIDKIKSVSSTTLKNCLTTETIGDPKSQAEPKAETKIQLVESASPGVWAYGLRLTAGTGALGMLLWAIVALCREE